MRIYIAITFLLLVIIGKLIGMINILLGKYTSIFVSFFTTAPTNSYQIKNLSKEEQHKFKYLAVLSGSIDIVISIVTILVLPKVATEMILFLAFLFYANSTFFRKYMSKVFKLQY